MVDCHLGGLETVRVIVLLLSATKVSTVILLHCVEEGIVASPVRYFVVRQPALFQEEQARVHAWRSGTSAPGEVTEHIQYRSKEVSGEVDRG